MSDCMNSEINTNIRSLEEDYIKKYLSDNNKSTTEPVPYKYFNPKLYKHIFHDGTIVLKSKIAENMTVEQLQDAVILKEVPFPNSYEENSKTALDVLSLMSVSDCATTTHRAFALLQESNTPVQYEHFLLIFSNWGHSEGDSNLIKKYSLENSAPNEHNVSLVLKLLCLRAKYFSVDTTQLLLRELISMSLDPIMGPYQFLISDIINVCLEKLQSGSDSQLFSELGLKEMDPNDALVVCVQLFPKLALPIGTKLSYFYLVWLLTGTHLLNENFTLRQLSDLVYKHKSKILSFPLELLFGITDIITLLMSSCDYDEKASQFCDTILKVFKAVYVKNGLSINRLKNWWSIKNLSLKNTSRTCLDPY